MKIFFDLIIAAIIVLGLFGVLASLPFIIFLMVFLGFSYFVYAAVHDCRIRREEEQEQEKEKDSSDDHNNPADL